MDYKGRGARTRAQHTFAGDRSAGARSLRAREERGERCSKLLGPGEGARKLRVAPSGGRMFHYGWVRPPEAQKVKLAEFDRWAQPLKESLPKRFGTRHRAAIGLSEETDSVLVVVSEESGAISYAFKGHLTRNVTLEELRAFLTSVFVTPARSRNWMGWLKSWRAEKTEPSPVLLARSEAPTTSAAASNPDTGVAQ